MSTSAEPGSLAFRNDGHASSVVLGRQYVNGNMNYYYNSSGSTQSQHIETAPNYAFGLNLADAPQIEESLFVGREVELAQIEKWLSPSNRDRNVVAVWGTGGMGKTQLCIQFAKRYQKRFSSIFWLNATDESTLKTALVNLSMRVVNRGLSPSTGSTDSEDQAVERLRTWLSIPQNNGWLLIYDNYDDPNIPGLKSDTGYDLRRFFPHAQQGSILITTRVSSLNFAKQLELLQLNDLQESLEILATRSGRKTDSDPDARKLASRLHGLPLALASAGAYLKQTPITFREYLHLYEDNLQKLEQHSKKLFEYQGRQLSTTWNISLKQVQDQDPEAAKLLRFLAYFNNQDIWYELLQPGQDCGLPWLSEVVKSKPRFYQAMAKLRDYSLVMNDTQTESYSMHACVHDWALGFVNHDLSDDLYRAAMHCVGRNVIGYAKPNSWLFNRRLQQHAIQLGSGRLKDLMNSCVMDTADLYKVACLHHNQGHFVQPEQIYLLALAGNERMFGWEHRLTLVIALSLGLYYSDRQRLPDAEQMLSRALMECERVLGPNHRDTLSATQILGNVYRQQGKLAKAEQILLQALAVQEKVLGQEHIETLDTVHCLGRLYFDQRKLAKAEQMWLQALAGQKKILGQEHARTLDTVHGLGHLYFKQEQLAKAEQTWLQALAGREEILGQEHARTLDTVHGLGRLYFKQEKLAKAEQMFQRALAGFENLYGLKHDKTQRVIYKLSELRDTQGRRLEAQNVSRRTMEDEQMSEGEEQKAKEDCRESAAWHTKLEKKMHNS